MKRSIRRLLLPTSALPLLVLALLLAAGLSAAATAEAPAATPAPAAYTPLWKERPWVTLPPDSMTIDVLIPVLSTPIPAEYLFTAGAEDIEGRRRYLGDAAVLTPGNLPATEGWSPPDLSAITADAPPELLLVAIAQNELGFREGEGNKNPYSYYFTRRYNAWCSEFVGYCNSQVQLRYGRAVVNTVFPVMTLSDHGMLFFKQAARFVTATDKAAQFYIAAPDALLGRRDYIPQVGDHMWFMWEQSSHETGHTAIVEGVSVDAKGVIWVHTLEGNNNKTTQRRSQRLSADHIYGYGTPVRRVQRVLARNMEGEDVLALKRTLAELGYYTEDGVKERVFTDALKAALTAFQRDHALDATGKMDNLTYVALEAAWRGLAE